MISIELIHCKIAILYKFSLNFKLFFLSLHLPLKRFRPDDQFNSNRIESTTPEHVYIHGQPTPPSPSQSSSRVGFHINH
jgi:hypothetical protein